MDITALKEALGDAKFSELETYVGELTSQRDQARNESINGRKTLKSELEQYKTRQTDLMEKLGIDSLDDLDSLDIKGQADAAKQYATKVTRLERQLAEASEALGKTEGKYKSSLQKSVITDAIGSHKFVAKDVVESFISNRLVWEGDEILFKNDEGNLVTVKDGVASFAKSRPELLEPTGAGGAGVRSGSVGSTGGQSTMSRAEFEALPPAKQMEAAKAGVTLQ